MCILPKDFYLYEGNEISYHATIKNKRTAAIFTVAVRLLYDSVLLSLYLQPAILYSVCDAHLQFISISENTILKIWNYHGILLYNKFLLTICLMTVKYKKNLNKSMIEFRSLFLPDIR